MGLMERPGRASPRSEPGSLENLPSVRYRWGAATGCATQSLMRLASSLLFALALLVCFLQFPRSVDFTGYLHYVARGLSVPPYPVGSASLGAFFQSPVVAVLLVPFTWVPLGVAKFAWAALHAVGIVWLARRFGPRAASLGAIVFLLCLFAHALSDVFLSGNTNITTLLLVVLGWHWIERERLALGGLAMGLAVFVKILPVVFLVWYLLLRRPKAVLAILGGAAFWFCFSLAFVSWEWWKAWLQALPLYEQAANLASESFQAPPSAVFRLSGDVALAKAVALALQASIFCLAFYRRSFSLLLALFFLGNPYPWALTMLFLYPLVAEMAENGIPTMAWLGALAYALLPKALWPEALWQKLVTANLPAYAILLVVIAAVLRQPYAARPLEPVEGGGLAVPLPRPELPG